MVHDRHLKEAAKEDAARQLWREWVRQRVELIHEQVTVYDVLRLIGVDLTQSGSDEEEQFSCPFHGIDRRPSARVYPEEGGSKSHAWCYVCQERWDAISVWQRAYGSTEGGFTRALLGIEKAFDLTAPKMPTEAVYRAEVVDEDQEEFEHRLEACEDYLRAARGVYRQLNDMVGYLSASQVLDKLRFRVAKGRTSPKRAVVVLRQLRNKIVEKECQCLEG